MSKLQQRRPCQKDVVMEGGISTDPDDVKTIAMNIKVT